VNEGVNRAIPRSPSKARSLPSSRARRAFREGPENPRPSPLFSHYLKLNVVKNRGKECVVLEPSPTHGLPSGEVCWRSASP